MSGFGATHKKGLTVSQAASPTLSYSTEQSLRVHGLVVDANIINNTDSKG